MILQTQGLKIFLPDAPVYQSAPTGNPYVKFIGQTITVQGFNEPRTLRITDVYGFGKRWSFKCEVVGNYSHFKNGDRENLQCTSVARNGKLIPLVKVLTA